MESLYRAERELSQRRIQLAVTTRAIAVSRTRRLEAIPALWRAEAAPLRERARVLLAVLGRLGRDEELRDFEACVAAGVDPFLHTRCAGRPRSGGVDLGCAFLTVWCITPACNDPGSETGLALMS